MTDWQTKLIKKFGPWAVVTGASDGIGMAFAKLLAEMGFNLILIARREAIIVKLAEDLVGAHQISAQAYPIDLSDSSSVERLLRETKSKDIGLLVAAAGFGTSGPFIENEIAAELNMVDVNCRALAQMTHHFAKSMVERKRGGIILMSSLVAFQGVPRSANYAATKAYVQSLAEGLNAELKPNGVSVLAVAPGPVRTGFAFRANMKMGASATAEEVAKASMKALGRRTTVRPGMLAKSLELALKPLPRMGRVMVMAKIMAGMTQRT